MRKGYVIIPVILYIILLSISVSAGVDDIDMQLLFNGNLDDETGNFSWNKLQGDIEYITDKKYEGTSAIYLDGNDCIINFTTFELDGNQTISFWLLINSTTPDHAGHVISHDPDASDYILTLTVSSGVYTLGWTVNGGATLISSFGADHLDDFFNVVLSYNGTHKIIYLDGLENVSAVHTIPNPASSALSLGCKPSGVSFVNDIALDDFRLYLNEHLTPVEILTIANPPPIGATETPTIVFPSPDSSIA